MATITRTWGHYSVPDLTFEACWGPFTLGIFKRKEDIDDPPHGIY
jgi:hypothetical protein